MEARGYIPNRSRLAWESDLCGGIEPIGALGTEVQPVRLTFPQSLTDPARLFPLQSKNPKTPSNKPLMYIADFQESSLATIGLVLKTELGNLT